MKRTQRSRGFTLIELMTVMAILGLLAAIILPRFVKSKYRAYVSACLENERNLATALESYRHDTPFYPANLNLLVSQFIIKKLPECPSAPGTAYVYEVAPGGEAYTISCAGYHYMQVLGQTIGYPQYVSDSGIKEN